MCMYIRSDAGTPYGPIYFQAISAASFYTVCILRAAQTIWSFPFSGVKCGPHQMVRPSFEA